MFLAYGKHANLTFNGFECDKMNKLDSVASSTD